MNDPINNHDLVDRAVAELIDAPVEEGPSQALVARTIAALKENSVQERPGVVGRIRRMGWMYKIAAAVFIGLCGVAVVLVMNRVGGGTVAAADVARKLREARTLSCNWTMEMPLGGKPVSMKMMFKEGGKLRVEVPGMAVTILDMPRSKLLVLNPMIKTAFALDIGDANSGPENQATEIFDWIEKIKNTTGRLAQSVGTRQIDGVEAKGFLLSEQGMDYTVWADAKTGTPLRIEIPIDMGNFKTTVVMSDLVFDQKLDESIFDTQPPSDYLLMNFDVPIFHGAPGEEDIVALLRWHAAHADGGFPKGLDRWRDFAKLARRGGDQKELMEVMMRVGRATAFLTALGEKSYGYCGAAVKMGDAQKMVFWYRVEGGERYRAIFGDLHTEDVSSQQIPASIP
jgi:outer membrane lipoprotein-sorting protein